MKSRIVLMLLLSVLAGCSARECKLDGAYLDARETGPLVNPRDGELPARDPSYDIPPIPEQEHVATRPSASDDGEGRLDCIDRPPRLPPAAAES